ncbi:MAG: hypothetical protein AAGJ35_12575 [Myxococcota bacterium]
MRPEDVLHYLSQRTKEGRTTLQLTNQMIGDSGLIALAAAPQLATFRSLQLWGNQITDIGIRALTESPYTNNIRKLELGENFLTDESISFMAGSEFLQELKYLHFTSNQISDEGTQLLAQAPKFSKLWSLHLQDNPVGFHGMQALATSTQLLELRELTLDTQAFGQGDFKTLWTAQELIGTSPFLAKLHGWNRPKLSEARALPWDEQAALWQRTAALARMSKEKPQPDLIPKLLPLLHPDQDEALTLWTLTLLNLWDDFERALPTLKQYAYVHPALETLRQSLLLKKHHQQHTLSYVHQNVEAMLF